MSLNSQSNIPLSQLSDTSLWNRTKELALEETQKTLEVLHHLREIERRKLYLSYGYPSLFEYAVKELKYSHSSAYRRIEAARLIQEIPQVEDKILEGSLNLTSVAQVRSFFKIEKNHPLNKNHDLNYKLNVISKIENLSIREVQKELVSLNPDFIPFGVEKEKVRAVGKEKFELKIIIDEKLKLKLDKLKSLMSHKNPNMNYHDLMSELADLALKKLDLSASSKRAALPAP
jgi:hypothetical protein